MVRCLCRPPDRPCERVNRPGARVPDDGLWQIWLKSSLAEHQLPRDPRARSTEFGSLAGCGIRFAETIIPLVLAVMARGLSRPEGSSQTRGLMRSGRDGRAAPGAGAIGRSRADPRLHPVAGLVVHRVGALGHDDVPMLQAGLGGLQEPGVTPPPTDPVRGLRCR